MANNAAKLLRRMRKSTGGWKRNDIDTVYEGFGFIIKPGGSHDKVYHPDYPELFDFLPRHTKVGEYIVKKLVNHIDKLKHLRAEAEKEEKEAEAQEENDEDE